MIASRSALVGLLEAGLLADAEDFRAAVFDAEDFQAEALVADALLEEDLLDDLLADALLEGDLRVRLEAAFLEALLALALPPDVPDAAAISSSCGRGQRRGVRRTSGSLGSPQAGTRPAIRSQLLRSRGAPRSAGACSGRAWRRPLTSRSSTQNRARARPRRGAEHPLLARGDRLVGLGDPLDARGAELDHVAAAVARAGSARSARGR